MKSLTWLWEYVLQLMHRCALHKVTVCVLFFTSMTSFLLQIKHSIKPSKRRLIKSLIRRINGDFGIQASSVLKATVETKQPSVPVSYKTITHFAPAQEKEIHLRFRQSARKLGRKKTTPSLQQVTTCHHVCMDFDGTRNKWGVIYCRKRMFVEEYWKKGGKMTR